MSVPTRAPLHSSTHLHCASGVDRDPALADSKFLLSALLDCFQSKIYFKDRQSRFVLINHAQARALNLEAVGQAEGKTDSDFYTEEHARQAFEDEQEIVRSGRPLLDVEEKETWPDGRITWASTSKWPLQRSDGTILGTFGVSRDVTEARSMRDALLESGSRFQELIAAIQEVFWIRDASSGRFLYISPAHEAISHQPLERVYEDPSVWLDGVHEDDRQRVAEHYAKVHVKPFELTFRIRRPDGEVRWIRQRAFPVFDAEKRPVRLAGLSADITEARRAHEDLQRTQRLLAAMVNSSQDGIFSESLDGVITTWNPAAKQIFGYSAEEIVGSRATRLLFPEQSEKDLILAHISRGETVENSHTVRRHKDGHSLPVALSASPVRDESGKTIGTSTTAHDLSARAELEQKLSTVEAQLRHVLQTAAFHVLVVDRQWRLTFVHWPRPGTEPEGGVGKTLWEFQPQLIGSVFEREYRAAMEKQIPRRCEAQFSPSIETPSLKRWFDTSAYPTPTGLLILVQDVTEKHLLDDQLRSAQKMEAIGQLASGIAHEINTPIQYVGDNTLFLKESWEQMTKLLETAQQLCDRMKAGGRGTPPWAEFDAAVQAADLPFLRDEVPKAIEQTLGGVDRVAKIVRAMKEFSHPGSTEKQAVDLNKAIEATVTIARNEWKYVADVELQLDPDLPAVVCLGAEINQVLLNLLVNAAHAIAEAQQRGGKGRGIITISSSHDGPWAELRIQDSGAGIAENVRGRIFDPFFTTKEVGKGSGQGLTLAQTVIVKKHAGRIWFDTETGQGTTFFVRLPVSGEPVT